MSDFMKDSDDTLIPFIKRQPVAFVKAKDHYLWDESGNRYTDFTAGIAVVNLGHCNERVNEAVKRQIDTIQHISNVYVIPQQAELAKLISAKSFPGKTFFLNSGAEANETALKVARYAALKKSPGKTKLLALEGSFHGRTIATITLTGQPKYRKGFEPLLADIEHIEFNNIESLRSKFDDKVAAVFIETVQVEGGVRIMTPEFVDELKLLAKKHDAYIIVDEVQTGIGRTGKMFGYQWYKLEPDMITLAKALGNGIPIGAAHIRDEISAMISPGLHMSTFGGNYTACAAGIAVMNAMDDKMLDRVAEMSEYINSKAYELKTNFPDVIGEVRIRGLVAGIDLNGIDVGDLMTKLLERRICVLRCGENTLRLVPPFTIGEADVDELFAALGEILE
jgi:predicted acetylornithine/succinylornithine family transaminase